MTDTVTKRLHISGLTPALTSSDLSARLSKFGTVKSLDGFDLKDGVGQPRKFAYATIEATPAALKKCFTSLSGTTWKGAKLRIGEAKSDYRERLAEERATTNEEPSRKRQRKHYSKYTATFGPDMTLVTRENAAKRPGWKVMPSGRMVRSMRMRPEKPLPPCSNNSEKNQVSSVTAKKKKKFRPLDSRARIRTIDVTKWNGEYLRGSLLDGQIIASPLLSRTEKNTGKSSSKGEVRDMEFETDPTMPSPSICPSEFTPAAVPQTSHVEQQVADSPPHPATTADDFALERAQNLSLFNALGDTERDGRESDSDIDESRVIEVEDYTGEEHYEIVPAAAIHGRTQTRDRDTPMEVEEPPPKEGETAVQPPPTAMKPTVSLKDLFAPREEDVGFSLLDHLDLGRDEEDDLDMGPFMMIPQGTEGEISNVTGATDSQVQPVNAPAVASTISKSSIHQRINLDPKTPLFFPKLETLFTTTTTKGSLVSPSPLYQSQTEEQIRQRWEENKVELTRGWKKRWREAMKVKRRRGGGKDLEVDL